MLKSTDNLRYFIELGYNGKHFHGWQIQPEARSVQEVMERTLSTLLRDDIKVVGAGRTDTGVHAKKFVAHFDAQEITDLKGLLFRLNSFLPKQIAVYSIFEVQDEAHARFDAIEREYQYHINLIKDPFLKDFCYLVHRRPDVVLMNQAARLLLDYTDFQCFSRSRSDVKTYNCTIKKAIWTEKDNVLNFTIVADRFLRNMVRAIVGTLLEVGYNKISIEEFHEIIKSKDRTKAGASAPARGLYLTEIRYPDRIKK